MGRSLFACLLLSQLSRLLAESLAPKGFQWQWHDASMHLAVCLLVGMIAWMVPYRRIGVKCMALAWLAFEIISLMESALHAGGIPSPAYILKAQVALAILLSAWYLMRAPWPTGDTLDDAQLFVCRLKPKCVQDVLLAMMGRAALGGIAIYCRGYLWHFQHGVLVKSRGFSRRYRYVAFALGVPAASTIATLDSMVGARWSPVRNCVTTLYAAVKFGRPLF